MAASAEPLVLLFLVMPLIFGAITCQSSPSSSSGNGEALPSERYGCSSSGSKQLDELESRVSALESIINERTQELIGKEETIRNMEMIIREKSNSIASLQSEIDFIQSASSEKHKSKTEEKVYQLEKQIFKLKREVEIQKKRRLELDIRAEVAEKKVAELGLKLENEQLVKAESEAASTHKKFFEINKEWLSYKLDLYLSEAQVYVATQWNERLRPTLYATAQKVYEKKDQVKKWSEPHIEMLNSEWVPTIKDAWLTFTIYLEPKIQLLTEKSMKVYQSSKRSLTPYLIQALNVTYNYVQIAKMHAHPYTSQVVTATKPHLDKAHVVLEPYTENIRHACTKLVNSARTYHQRAQELLKSNELTKTVATVDLAWFVATALLGLPLIFVIKLFSAISNTKPKRYDHKHHAINRHRRPKRPHS